MKEFLAGIVVLAIFGFLFYFTINWLMLPSYINKIADELREIKEEIKKKN